MAEIRQLQYDRKVVKGNSLVSLQTSSQVTQRTIYNSSSTSVHHSSSCSSASTNSTVIERCRQGDSNMSSFQNSVKSLAEKFSNKKPTSSTKFYDGEIETGKTGDHPKSTNWTSVIEPLHRQLEISETLDQLNDHSMESAIHYAKKPAKTNYPASDLRHHITYRNDDEAAVEMKRLNNILSDYKAEVFLLEANNKRLQNELERIKQPLLAFEQYDNAIKIARQTETSAWHENDQHLRAQLAAAKADAEVLQMRLDQARKEREDNMRRLADLQQQILDLENRLSLLKLQAEDGELTNQELKSENDFLNDTIRNLRTDLELERQQRAAADAQVQRMHSEKMDYVETVTLLRKEVLQSAALPVPEYSKADIKDELDNIRRDYERSRDKLRDQFEQKIGDFHRMWMDENRQSDQLRLELADLRSQNDRYLHLQTEVADYRQRLTDLQYELEVAQQQYKLLQEQYDLENNRWKEMKKFLENERQNFGDKSKLYGEVVIYRDILESKLANDPMLNGLHSPRSVISPEPTMTSYETTDKGSVVIEEIDMGGRFITIKNLKRDLAINLNGWLLTQNVNGRESIRFFFPNGLYIQPGATMKVWANVYGSIDRPPKDIVFRSQRSWGIGDVETVLLDAMDKEHARFVRTHTGTAI